MNKKAGLIILILAYLLLIPGVSQPMLSLTGLVDRADLAVLGKDIIVGNPEMPEFVSAMAEALVANMEIDGTVQAYHKTRSIFGTARDLYQDNHLLVAFLIVLFSIVIPVLKGVLILAAQLCTNATLSDKFNRVSSAASKWSMADVFLIGVFVAFLAANAVEKEGGFLTFEAELETGFYYFLSYCLLSILASQMLNLGERK
jgi:uncharacterized paraquat-inducible protein A